MVDDPTAPLPTPPADAPAPTRPRLGSEEPTLPFGGLRLRRIGWRDPFRWLALGWRDFTRCPGLGLFHGACFAGMGAALLLAFNHAPAWTLALSGGFLLLAPLLCVGLYHASRALERAERPDLGDSLLAWDERIAPLAVFAILLLVIELLWARASMVVFAVSFDGPPLAPGSSPWQLLQWDNAGFIAGWLGVGFVFASLLFGLSAIALPLILDRGTDAVTAGLTSLRLVLGQPGVMGLWALMIAVLTSLALLPGFLGLIIVAPVLGHASWHAYRAGVSPGMFLEDTA